MVQHICKLCNYTSTHKGNYDKHFLSKKHNMNIEEQNKVNIPTIIDMSNNIITKIDNLSKQNESVLKQNEQLRTEIEKLKDINNKNTNKIVKEARLIKKSILAILNTNFHFV